VTREALWPEQPGDAGQPGPDVCPALVSCLNTLVSGLDAYDGMVGAGYAGSLEPADQRLIYRDYSMSLNRKGPKVMDGKQAKHSFVLRQRLARGRRWVVSTLKKGIPRRGE